MVLVSVEEILIPSVPSCSIVTLVPPVIVTSLSLAAPTPFNFTVALLLATVAFRSILALLYQLSKTDLFNANVASVTILRALPVSLPLFTS